MQVTSFETKPILEVPFLNAGRGQGSFYVDKLPVHLGTVDALPDGVSALVLTADLQGRSRFEDSIGPPPLLGESLPTKLVNEILPELDLPAGRVGALLAGDFYTVPNLDKRGGSGDVVPVWQAFGNQFDWVAGVAGNHDVFGSDAEQSNFQRSWKKTQASTRVARKLGCSRLHYLDEQSVTLDGLRIAGVSGIIGYPTKLQRRSEEDYLFAIESVLESQPDVLILHDGPDDPGLKQRGSSSVRETLEAHGDVLVVRGHSHWSQPFVELKHGVQVINVDCRVAILTA